jgi:hypothetical protein
MSVLLRKFLFAPVPITVTALFLSYFRAATGCDKRHNAAASLSLFDTNVCTPFLISDKHVLQKSVQGFQVRLLCTERHRMQTDASAEQATDRPTN